MRHTGIPIIGDVPWGTHFCQFYQDKQDLADLLVPYFSAGLRNNEFCMWVTSAALEVEDARAAHPASLPEFDRFAEAGAIKIIDYTQWYTLGGRFDADRVLRGWVDELAAARARGFDGLRLSGNTFWLEQSAWRDFTEYEAAVDSVLHRYPMLALCTYSLARCGAVELLEVMANHAFALIKRAGRWQVIESAERKVIAVEPGRDFAYVKLGNTYNRLARYQDAVAAFLTAEKSRPKDPVLYNNLAFAYGRLGKSREQIAALRRAVSLRPRYATARLNLGTALLKAGDRAGAQEQLAALREFDEPAAASLRQQLEGGKTP